MTIPPLSRDDFQKHLNSLLAQARTLGFSAVEVTSGNLHRAVGAYPGPNHRMPVCCAVMRDTMGSNDEIVPPMPPKGNGANIRIRYQLG
jgi:5-methylcytosine-specific restriction protein A